MVGVGAVKVERARANARVRTRGSRGNCACSRDGGEEARCSLVFVMLIWEALPTSFLYVRDRWKDEGASSMPCFLES